MVRRILAVETRWEAEHCLAERRVPFCLRFRFLFIVMLAPIPVGCSRTSETTDHLPMSVLGRHATPNDSATEGLSAPLAPEERLELVKLKDEAVGHLFDRYGTVDWHGREMESREVAARIFERLARRLPDERLPHHNLAITRCLQLYHAGMKEYETAKTKAVEACDRLLLFDPDSAIALWLAAGVALTPPTWKVEQSHCEKNRQQATAF